MIDADDGALLALLEATPWERTPLGPRASWSQSLKTAWSICHRSRFPIILFWGPEFVQLYNAAYIPIVGDKHPRAFGQRSAECFAEIWDQIGPMLRGVLEDGVATYSEDLFLPLDRGEGPEACYFTFSYSPVLGEGERAEGVFCAVTETTRKVLGERRLRTLNTFEETVRSAETVELAAEAAVASFVVSGDAAACEVRLNAPHHHLARAGLDAATPIVEPLSDGNVELGTIAFARNALNPLDDDYRAFFQLAAKHTAAALARTMAYEAEHKRMAALEELDRAKNAFFHNVSHEFRTPLMLMLGPLDDLYARVLDIEQRRTIELARRNAVRLQKLVDTLLEFSRVESGRADAAFVRTDGFAVTRDIASEFRSAFEAAGLRLDVRNDGVPDDLWLDRAMYEKILLNLLSNALKFTFEGGVTVTTGAAGGRFVLSVADTGTGIPPADLPQLFERFHRVRGARSRSHEGSGIGLALVRELVAIHGGTVEATSAVDEGSTFQVTFPLGSAHLPAAHIVSAPRYDNLSARRQYREEADAIARAGDTPAPAAPGSDRRPRILLADDNADLRSYVGSLLASRYLVDMVADGAALLEAARSRPPDLILTDVMMPGVDGIAAVQQLRAFAATRDVPVLMFSARAGDDASIDGLGAGADDYLVKPFTGAQLLARVDTLLRRADAFQSSAVTRRHEAQEWRLLAAAAERFAVAQSPEGVLEALADMLVPSFADWCVVQLREGTALRRVAIAHPQRAKRDLLWTVDGLYPYAVGDESMIGIAAATGQTQFAPELTHDSLRSAARDPVHLSILEALQLRSAIVVALREGDRIVGLVTVVQSESGRRFTEGDARTLERLATRTMVAYAAAASSERERSIASTLQRALLPGTLPIVDGLAFSVSYTTAAEDVQIGGDWYDAFPLADGRIVLSIGDVVGHGLDAAVAMATLRHAIRGFAVEDNRPAAIIAHLNRVLLSEGRGDLATALVAVVDPRTLEVVFSSAGHYGPAIATANGSVRHLTLIGTMLGIEETTYEEFAFRLPPGATMVLYTDGLIEAERDVTVGLAQLDAAIPAALTSDDIARAIHAHVFDDRRPHDDVAVFAVTATAAIEHLDLTTTTAPERAAGIRLAVRRFLSSTALAEAKIDDMVTATGEALSNAMEHAYPNGVGALRVTGRANGDVAAVEIRDFGAWRERTQEGRGLGMPLMHALSDDVAMEQTPAGTRVEIVARGERRPAAIVP